MRTGEWTLDGGTALVGEPHEQVDYETTPLTRQEYISAIVHLYRGELHRATAWRIRLDTTTNWAVLTSGGLLAFAFRGSETTHWALLLGMLLITMLMGYEARRFQVFDVWRARVRKIEENFYGPILTRNPVSPQREWGPRVAYDLLHPRYKIGFLPAVRARLVRNYWAIYLILLLAWALKVTIHPDFAHSWADIRQHLESGRFLPFWLPLAFVGVFVLGALLLLTLVARAPQSDDHFWLPPLEEARDVSPLDI